MSYVPVMQIELDDKPQGWHRRYSLQMTDIRWNGDNSTSWMVDASERADMTEIGDTYNDTS